MPSATPRSTTSSPPARGCAPSGANWARPAPTSHAWRAAGRARLRRGLDAADACGATPLAERARAELLATGALPRRPRLWGAEALTASERRIASMAADGLSNPEIAQALFVTTKTVEAHLGSAYAKLEIGSRARLQDALARASAAALPPAA